MTKKLIRWELKEFNEGLLFADKYRARRCAFANAEKLTRWGHVGYAGELEPSEDGIWLDFDEVKELIAEQEKKTKILLDALEEIADLKHAGWAYDYCEGYCHVEAAQEAIEKYKKEEDND